VTELAYELIPLGQLAAGCRATVAAVMGVSEQVHRLRELGLRDGAPVEMLQPGSPCIVRLAGHKLCFRADELLKVLVKLGTSSPVSQPRTASQSSAAVATAGNAT
jgi:Fe2+ transport system protein FeoA